MEYKTIKISENLHRDLKKWCDENNIKLNKWCDKCLSQQLSKELKIGIGKCCYDSGDVE